MKTSNNSSEKGSNFLLDSSLDDGDIEDNDDKETDTDDDYGGFAFVQDVLCSMQDKLAIPKSWILLHSQSTVDMFSNPKLLDYICDAKRLLTLHCNAGKV